MEVASLQACALQASFQPHPENEDNLNPDSMDIDMDLDLGPLPDPESIELVSAMSILDLFSNLLLMSLDRSLLLP